ncbi:MAG: cbb3-type cytochrome c oxidase subunit I [Gemmatimonadales bacterium]|nr:cbb3-type cytochrome c oxidase subunit I [Gemmatimonadales bacterium]
MAPHVIWFLKASLAWLALGVTMGLAMAIQPAMAVYRAAHFHMLFLGFVTMMIAGVGYHIIPRFAATHLHAPKLPLIHFFLANVGLALLVAGFVLRVHARTSGVALLASGGTLSAAGAYALAWNLWRTLDHAVGRPSRLRSANSTVVPLMHRSRAAT